VHSLAYDFDAIGNVKQRIDSVQAITENFTYDKLNRLIQASGPTLATRSFTYNAIGNMTYKSDVGTYAYPAIGSARPHAVSSVTGGAANTITASYTYDPNGSLISASGTIYPASGSVIFSRTLTYTSFNMPATIAHTQGASSYSYTYTYSVEHERVRLVTVRPDDTLTSIYLHPAGKGALLYEKEIRQSDGRIEHKHYVNGGSGLVGVFVTKSVYAVGDGPQMRYYHRDHLGSIAVITNPSGAVLERLSYEAFGERRNANGTPQNRASPLIGITTDRGYTAHEHLDELNLIHMNGRIYDPALGRFMTADLLLQAPDNLQSYNRYSYVFNNPLMYTDPSGYKSLRKAFKSITKPFEKAWKKVWHSEIGRIAVSFVAAYFTYGMAAEFLAANANWAVSASWGASEFAAAGYTLSAPGALAAGAAGGFGASFAASGGNFEAGLRGAVSGAIGAGIGLHYGSNYGFERVLAESAASGINSELSGGSFADGFKRGFAISALAYINVQARGVMKEQSQLNAANASGRSGGLFGDLFKLGGARMIEDAGRLRSPEGFWEQFFGGRQGGDGAVAGFNYGPGSLNDRVVEAWAGPHDFFNNLTGSYNPATGNAIGTSGMGSFIGEISNGVGVLIVAPVAISGLIRSENLPVAVRPRH
jgi:RHS repeat-associated protein